MTCVTHPRTCQESPKSGGGGTITRRDHGVEEDRYRNSAKDDLEFGVAGVPREAVRCAAVPVEFQGRIRTGIGARPDPAAPRAPRPYPGRCGRLRSPATFGPTGCE